MPIGPMGESLALEQSYLAAPEEEGYIPTKFKFDQVDGPIQEKYRTDREILLELLRAEIEALPIVDSGMPQLDKRVQEDKRNQIENPEEYFYMGGMGTDVFQYSRLLHAVDEAVIHLSQSDDSDPTTTYDELIRIAVDGEYKGQKIDQQPPETLDSYEMFSARAFWTQLLVQNKEVFESMFEKQAFGVHGASSSSLLGVVKHGLKPQGGLDPESDTIGFGTFDEGSLPFGLNDDRTSHFFLYKFLWLHNYLPSEDTPLDENSIRQKIEHLVTKVSGILETMGGANKDKTGNLDRIIKMLQNTERVIANPESVEEQSFSHLAKANFPVVYASTLNSIKENAEKPVHKRTVDDFHVSSGTPRGSDIILVPEAYVDEVKQFVEEAGGNNEVLSLEPVIRAASIAGPYPDDLYK